MCKLTRILMAWLLLLTITVQGVAAGMMLFCAPAGHRSVSQFDGHAAVSAHFAQSDSHAGHQHDARDVSLFSSDSSDVPADHASTGHPGTSDHGKCSSYAGCCTASIIVSCQLFDDVAMTGSELIPFIQESIVNFTPDGLDPPPKSFLA